MGTGFLKRSYSAAEIDAIAAYCPDTDRCYFLPQAWIAGRSHIALRLSAARNSQKLGLNWAAEFDFDSLNWDEITIRGAIAQLGERLHGMQEVAGSSPAGSMEEPAKTAGSSLF